MALLQYRTWPAANRLGIRLGVGAVRACVLGGVRIAPVVLPVFLVGGHVRVRDAHAHLLAGAGTAAYRPRLRDAFDSIELLAGSALHVMGAFGFGCGNWSDARGVIERTRILFTATRAGQSDAQDARQPRAG